MVSRARMETFFGLVFLTVVALWQDNNLSTTTSTLTQTRTKSVVTNSWLAAGSRAEKCDLPWQKLSYPDRTDCQVRAAHAICAVPALERPRPRENDNNNNDNNDNNDHAWPIPYQCDGPAYEELEAALRKFVAKPEHAPTWGKRAFGLPAHKRVLFLGNIHVQQMAASMACQLASDNNDNNDNDNDDDTGMIVDWQILVHDADVQATRVEFANNSTLFMVHDARVTTTDDWPSLLRQATDGWWLTDFDALILGLFNDCTTELRSHAYECASLNSLLFRHMVEWYGTRGPILFVSEMAATRVDESNQVRDWIRYYRDTVGRKTMWFINGRRYISEIHLEGAAAHGGAVNATTLTVDALNGGSLARALPRCQGAYGGHADLLAWDVTEFLYHHLV